MDGSSFFTKQKKNGWEFFENFLESLGIKLKTFETCVFFLNKATT